MDRKRLENLLIHLVMTQHFAEQNEIQQKLRENGFDLPQSTLSRWLKKLNINKINQRYTVHAALTQIPIYRIKISLPNLIVLHTLPGSASALGYQIDQRMNKNGPYQGVAGTIAGDDVVLIIMENEESLLTLKNRLEQNREDFCVVQDKC